MLPQMPADGNEIPLPLSHPTFTEMKEINNATKLLQLPGGSLWRGGGKPMPKNALSSPPHHSFSPYPLPF